MKRLIYIFFYYVYKVMIIALSCALYCFFRFSFLPGIYYGAFKQPKKFSGRIIFAFWNRKRMHLGDQIFHEPLIRYLSSQYDVTVSTYPAFAPYFKALGYKTVTPTELVAEKLEGAIFISKYDSVFSVAKNFPKRNWFIGFDYRAMSGEGKIVNLLIVSVLSILKEIGAAQASDKLPAAFNIKPMIPENLTEAKKEEWEDALRGCEYYAYNPYVASDFIGVVDKKKKLEAIVRQKRGEGYSIILLGTEQEKKLDSRSAELSDIDLRGKTDPYSLFKLFSMPNVMGVIGFDTFCVHVASLFEKELYVIMRSKGEKELIRERFVPMYPGVEAIVKYYD